MCFMYAFSRHSCSIHYCDSCFLIRYGDNVDTIPEEYWTCFRCQKICNCSRCFISYGIKPLYRLKGKDSSSVHDLIVNGEIKLVKLTTFKGTYNCEALYESECEEAPQKCAKNKQSTPVYESKDVEHEKDEEDQESNEHEDEEREGCETSTVSITKRVFEPYENKLDVSQLELFEECFNEFHESIKSVH